MPKILRVGVQDFEIPLQGENPDYGESLTDFFESVSEALETVQQPNDVLRTSASILNNQTTFTSVPGFSFDVSEVKSINAEFFITRTTVSPANNLTENGVIEGNFDGTAWSITVRSIGDAGVDFEITSGGQIQYKSTNLVGTSYAGSLIFRAKVFNAD